MNQNIDYIDIGFLNCECSSISIDHIVCMKMDGISEEHTICNGRYNKRVEIWHKCQSLHLVISPKANSEHPYLGKVINKDFHFERIQKYNDITNIGYFSIKEGLLDSFDVPYKYDDFLGEENEYQKSFINEKGELEIIIKRVREHKHGKHRSR